MSSYLSRMEDLYIKKYLVNDIHKWFKYTSNELIDRAHVGEDRVREVLSRNY